MHEHDRSAGALSGLEGDAPRGRFGSALIAGDGTVLESDGVWDRAIGIPIGERVQDAVAAADRAGLERALADAGERLALVVRTGAEGGALVSLLLLEGVHRDGTWYVIGMRTFQPAGLEHGAGPRLDAVSGLLDRAGLERALEAALQRCARGDTAALLLLDLDGFKQVNDAYGHAVGDGLIAAVGAGVRAVLRDGDVAARLGGDEFAVVLHRASPAAARAAAERVLGAVERARPDGFAAVPGAQASAGLAVLRSGGAIDVDEALTRADLALYEAKAEGRGRVVEYPSADPEAAARMRVRLSWGQRLHRALEGDGLALHAEPVVDLRTGALAGYGLRLHLADGDEPLPAEAFRDHAVRAGLTARLDQWLVARAPETVAAYRGALRGAPVAIAVSGGVLADRSLAARLQNELARLGVEPSRIALAVRDAASPDDREAARESARALRRLGVGLALAGFGGADGSLEALRELPFSALEVERPFTAAAGAGAVDDAVLRYAAAVGADFDMDVTAGGLASPADLERARDLGIALGRGPLFGAPLPIEQALARAQPAA